MTTWFTADLHLGHANIIRYSGRPFVDADAMNRALQRPVERRRRRRRRRVAARRLRHGQDRRDAPLVGEMRGRKLLLTGNHDRCWAGHGRRAEGWTERYLEAGFAEVVHGQINVDIGGTAVVACHFPYRGDSQDQDRYVEQAMDALASSSLRMRARASR